MGSYLQNKGISIVYSIADVFIFQAETDEVFRLMLLWVSVRGSSTIARLIKRTTKASISHGGDDDDLPTLNIVSKDAFVYR